MNGPIGQFLAMGGYAGYVWPAYGFAVLVIGGMILRSLGAYRRTKRDLETAQRARR